MLSRLWRIVLCGVTVAVAMGCTGDDLSVPTPRSVEDPAVGQANSRPPLRIGTIVAADSPTAPDDEALRLALDAAANATDGRVVLDSIDIDDEAEAGAAVASLVERGVTVIVTSCDDRVVPAVIDEAIASGLLAVTGCVAVPSPDIGLVDDLFADLAGLSDDADALAQVVDANGWSTPMVLSSSLVSDVADVCDRGARSLRRSGSAVTVESWLGLVDDPDEVVAGLEVNDVDSIVLCALAPSVVDMVEAIRRAGIDLPVLVTWPAADVEFDSGVGDVFVLDPGGDADSGRAVDAVTADAVELLDAAATRANSSGSIRISEVLRRYRWQLGDAVVEVDENGQLTGRAWFVSTVGPDGDITDVTLVEDQATDLTGGSGDGPDRRIRRRT